MQDVFDAACNQPAHGPGAYLGELIKGTRIDIDMLMALPPERGARWSVMNPDVLIPLVSRLPMEAFKDQLAEPLTIRALSGETLRRAGQQSIQIVDTLIRLRADSQRHQPLSPTPQGNR